MNLLYVSFLASSKLPQALFILFALSVFVKPFVWKRDASIVDSTSKRDMGYDPTISIHNEWTITSKIYSKMQSLFTRVIVAQSTKEAED